MFDVLTNGNEDDVVLGATLEFGGTSEGEGILGGEAKGHGHALTITR
jgi:hypothetical protein